MSGKAKTADRKVKPAKKGPPRGWHVRPYLPTEEGLTEEEARALAVGLLNGSEIVPPEGEAR